MILSINEYDKLQICEIRDIQKNKISKQDATILQSIIIDEIPVFNWRNRCLVAQHWVGVIDLPEYTIEILPKISGFHTIEEIRAILTRMLLVTHKATSTKRMNGSVAIQKNALPEILIDAFISSLEAYLKNGLLNEYQKIEKRTNVIKGRILVNKQFNKNPYNLTQFFCRYSKYIEDNYINRFFKLCLTEMKSISKDSYNLHRIQSNLNIFSDVGSLTLTQALAQAIQFNITNVIAKEPYTLGHLFLSNNYMTINAGNTPVKAMLFDMNHLFERFIYEASLQAFGNNIQYQNRGYYLLSNLSNSKKYIRLRPDIMLKLKNGYTIIDTKWKLPKSFAKESDVYQMNAYSSGLPKIQKVYLLYPAVPEIERFIGDYSFISTDGNNRLLGIRAIDLSICLNWKKFIAEFRAIF